jgi:tetratricopeptide repeat protein/glycosyl transferase family 9 (putative heptosyltransferase)
VNTSEPLSFSKALALHSSGNLNEAGDLYAEFLRSHPTHPDALSLLGALRARQGNLKEGIRLLKIAIAIKPDHPEAHYDLGNVFHQLRQYEEAVASFSKDIAISPNKAKAYNSRGVSLYRLGRYAEAANDFEKTITLVPDFTRQYHYLSIIRLSLGDYEKGWRLFEWRWKGSTLTPRQFQQPLWLGKESLPEKTILLHAEQGNGDIIQFCRYIPMVDALGAKVILEVPGQLLRLMETLEGSYKVVKKGDPLPAFDMHCPLMSLPLAFNTVVSTIPADVPYLSVDPRQQKKWREMLGTKTKPRIGLTWSGAIGQANDHNRSIPLKMLLPLLQYQHEYYSLQKEIRPGDLPALSRSKIISHADKLDDFSDTAALLSQMDIVISVDTSVAHLAGAMGKPVWIMLPFVSDFRWMTEREDSPWYPTARLFRQKRIGDWADVIDRVNVALGKTVGWA